MRILGLRCLACWASAAALIWGQPHTALAADDTARVGRPAPEFRLETPNGGRLDLRQFKDRPLFINVFATWCPPCKLELPNIVRQYPRYKPSVAFLGIDEQESPGAVKAFLRVLGIRYAVGIDPGSVGALYGVASLPESIFIDRHGVVRLIWRGYMPPNIFAKNMALIVQP